MTSLRISLIAAAALSVVGGAALAQTAAPGAMGAHYKGERFASMTRVSLDTARITAMKAHPGEITDQELEKESGGSGLRYSFDIKKSGKIFEVGVDAKTGRVLENKAEGTNSD